MGAGGDNRGARPLIRRNSWSFEKLKRLGEVKQDLLVLKHLWFGSLKHGGSASDHAARLESFYAPQAAAYDKFRSRFLWGRKPMLAACAARLREQDGRDDLVWVDLGGGTGENVDLMSSYIPLERFKAIYVVDLCHSLCEQARAKVAAKGWTNVHVVEGDACAFEPLEGRASLVTFSYSLSMIPPFVDAVDNACSWLAPDGLLAVADFYVSAKYDLPMRQMNWRRRFFWRSIFDIDNIDIGPERRALLESKLERVWELNSEGSIPYVPYLRAPYYVWLGRPWPRGDLSSSSSSSSGSGGGSGALSLLGGSSVGGGSIGARRRVRVRHEQKVEAPPLFPPTFLYTQSWEDPEPDMKVMDIRPDDVVLTLTSGGCNALNLLLHGAGHVVSVDCNPAQSSLLELKAVAIRQLEHEDVWQMFGEGRHPRVRALFEARLAPYLSQKALQFWGSRLWYFEQGLYYQGGMGKLCWVLQVLATVLGLSNTVKRLANAPTLEAQKKQWDAIALVHFVKHGPRLLVWLFCKLIALLLFNRFVLWFGGGVPCKQYKLIQADGVPIERYIARTLDGVAENSSLRRSNYFYYNCLTGKFLRDNCPSYLLPANTERLRGGLIDNLTVASGFFLDELRARTYSKVILMDHVDWLDEPHARELANALGQQVVPGGVVIWRSASLTPPYVCYIEAAGFEVRCLQRATDGYMDRVNMYSSFYMAKRREA